MGFGAKGAVLLAEGRREGRGEGEQCFLWNEHGCNKLFTD
jgi:hypothetical protein